MKNSINYFFILLLLLTIFLVNADEIAKKDYEGHLKEILKKLPSTDFNAMIQEPFIVISDCPKDQLEKKWAKGTIKWAVTNLKKSYFSKDPDEIIDIWLFKDKESYEKYTEKLWGKVPTTPYGYYSPSEKVLVMNISTGGGTLVHEIVHPFMHSNFPDCPAWFNEGMGSLYEQSAYKNEKIWGLTNWRLAGLKSKIEKGKLPKIEELMKMTDEEFYNSKNGIYSDNYAQARYLLYYLQEKDLLISYYKEFTTNQKDDPTGFKSFKKILNETDMVAFQKRWEAYAKELKYPE
jgi:hypothetical protein